MSENMNIIRKIRGFNKSATVLTVLMEVILLYINAPILIILCYNVALSIFLGNLMLLYKKERIAIVLHYKQRLKQEITRLREQLQKLLYHILGKSQYQPPIVIKHQKKQHRQFLIHRKSHHLSREKLPLLHQKQERLNKYYKSTKKQLPRLLKKLTLSNKSILIFLLLVVSYSFTFIGYVFK